MIARIDAVRSYLVAPIMAGVILLESLAAPVVQGQQPHEQRNPHPPDHSPHFTHPLLAESVSPDTKIRLDFVWLDLEESSESELELEGEYAFHPSFSIEAGVHYHATTGELGETHVLFKFANYPFEERNVLLGYGIELGLPTGVGRRGAGGHLHGAEHDHGEPEPAIYEIAPFLNAGLIDGPWEIAGWTIFGIPTNHKFQQNVGTELRYHASVLYHLGSRAQALLEGQGWLGLSGPHTRRVAATLAPGLRFNPFPDRKLALGAALSVPVTQDRPFDYRGLLSLFYHF